MCKTWIFRKNLHLPEVGRAQQAAWGEATGQARTGELEGTRGRKGRYERMLIGPED